MSVYTLHIPAPDDFINANQRQHRYGVASRTRNWRQAGAQYARSQKLPKLQRARIVAELHFADARQRDDHNYFGTIKALIDGVVGDYGLLPNDNADHLVGVELRRGAPLPRKRYGPTGAVTLIIEEVTS
jgi:crossover junction endodeoxyribonuclease RusA